MKGKRGELMLEKPCQYDVHLHSAHISQDSVLTELIYLLIVWAPQQNPREELKKVASYAAITLLIFVIGLSSPKVLFSFDFLG